MANKAGKVLIFAGAGASKAVSPESFPTTVEFFDRLPDSIKGDPLFSLVLRFVLDVTKTDIVDIELILWNLQQLRSFFLSIHEPSDIVGYAIRSSIMKLYNKEQNSGHLVASANYISSQIENLIDKIDEVVFDFYGYEPSEDELKDNWMSLLRYAYNNFDHVDIFTTNYDIVIESALDSLLGTQTANKIQGLKGRRRMSLELSNWVLPSTNSGGLLTKLHGSLDWKISRETVYIGDPVFTGDHSKQAIIYPGFKGKSGLKFFDPFHGYLNRSISSSDLLLFVGFAFRDEYINESIRNNISPDAKVVVINPDKDLLFPYPRSRAKHIRRFFDGGAIKELSLWRSS